MFTDSDNDHPNGRRGTMIGAGIAIGIGCGVALGLSFGNLALGLAVGAAFGVAIGAALESHDAAGRSGERPFGAGARPSGRVLLALVLGVGLVFALVVLSVVLTLSLGRG